MALISQSELESRLGRTLTSAETTAFALINGANQAYVEKMIGSSVEVATEATRYYDGGLQNLPIDPCTDITALKFVDEDQVVIETIDASDYIKEPVNRTLKTMIRARYGKLYNGYANIGVTAKFSVFGDTDTLNIIKNAMLEALVGEIDSSSNLTKESIEGYSVEYAKTQTRDLLDTIKFIIPGII
jgi:hypothetical protein